MASKVGANKRTLVHKESGGTVSFMPDVCKTPQPSGPPVPIPGGVAMSDPPAARARRGWREKVEPGLYRAHRLGCARSADRRPGGRCDCPFSIVVPGPDRLAETLSRYRISSREAEVVRLLAEGRSYREIEEQLCISMATVKTHVYNIYRKMGIRRRWQLLQILQSPEVQGGAGGASRPVGLTPAPSSDVA